jgi:SSS family solute:Na+ symporter
MAQNFWIAIFAWATCLAVTAAISLVTRAKPVSELHNLVYGMTDIPHEGHLPWFKRPVPLAMAVVVVLVSLNLIFW